MSRLISALLHRNWMTVLVQTVILTMIGAIALIFAWMSPSLRESELAVWEAMPDEVRVAFEGEAGDSSCVAIYSLVSVFDQSGHVLGHPDVVVVGSGARGHLGVSALEGGQAALDATAQTQLGRRVGGRVDVHVGVADPIPLEIVADTPPVRLNVTSQGSLFVAELPPPVTELYGPPDNRICFGAEGQPAAAIAADIRSRHAGAGLASATEIFGGVAGLAWSGTVLTAALAQAARRRPVLGVLRALGHRDAAIAPSLVAEVAVAAIAGLALSTALALAIRTYLLHMWTSPSAQGLTTLTGVALTAASLAAVMGLTMRLVSR